MSQQSEARHRAAAPRHHRFLKAFGYTLVTLTVTMMLFVSYTVRSLTANVDVVGTDFLTDRPEKEFEGPREPLNVLIMGSDSRAGANSAYGKDDGHELSDTTILLHLSGDRKSAYGVSLPRDAMVQRPDCTKPDGSVVKGAFSQWNTAFSKAGPTCTVQQVEALTGVRVDHFVIVDFSGFQGMVDAVGGVEICVPKAVNDRKHGIFLDAGTRTVKGKEALDYVRVRTGISANGDIGRMKRQQVFIASMIDRVMSKGVLARPDRLIGFLKAATSSLTVDAGLQDIRTMADLGMEFKNIDLDNIQFITVPFETYQPNINRLVWTDEADDLWAKMRLDQPLSAALSGEAVTAGEESPVAQPSTSASPSPSSDEPSDEPEAEPTKSAKQIAAENGLCA